MVNRLRALLSGIKALELAASSVAGLVLLIIMAIVVVDVIGRYVFNSPLSWSYDVISLYLMGASFFLTLSDTLRRNHHVIVDIIYNRLGKRTRYFWNAIGWSLSSALFISILVLAAKKGYVSWSGKEVIDGTIAWPTWIGPAIATFGLILISGRLVLGAAAFWIAFLTGDERYCAGALDGSEEGSLENQ
jgi:TRAP-type C4-dicarboxylate transport system permease small subunit